jgi:hypothetical protein
MRLGRVFAGVKRALKYQSQSLLFPLPPSGSRIKPARWYIDIAIDSPCSVNQKSGTKTGWRTILLSHVADQSERNISNDLARPVFARHFITSQEILGQRVITPNSRGIFGVRKNKHPTEPLIYPTDRSETHGYWSATELAKADRKPSGTTATEATPLPVTG